MKYEYNYERKVEYSECDKDCKLGLLGIMNISQDTSTTYYEKMKSDNITLREKNNAAWVYTKIKIHIINTLKWNEKMYIKDYTTLHSKIKSLNEITIKDKKGNTLIYIGQESCLIDLTSRKIRKLDTISYPPDIEDEKKKFEEPFERMNWKYDEYDYSYKQLVQPSDIDFTKHTNNTMYVQYMMNSINTDFWVNKKITDFEIQFLKESREGETLTIYRKEENGKINFLLKRNDDEIAKGSLKYIEIK